MDGDSSTLTLTSYRVGTVPGYSSTTVLYEERENIRRKAQVYSIYSCYPPRKYSVYICTFNQSKPAILPTDIKLYLTTWYRVVTFQLHIVRRTGPMPVFFPTERTKKGRLFPRPRCLVSLSLVSLSSLPLSLSPSLPAPASLLAARQHPPLLPPPPPTCSSAAVKGGGGRRRRRKKIK